MKPTAQPPKSRRSHKKKPRPTVEVVLSHVSVEILDATREARLRERDNQIRIIRRHDVFSNRIDYLIGFGPSLTCHNFQTEGQALNRMNEILAWLKGWDRG